MTDSYSRQPGFEWPVADRSIRVLHVDNNARIAEVTAEFLERQDDRFTVRSETALDEAFDRLIDEEFDCVISDYDMPEQNGIDLLESVRAKFDTLPFILYTGEGSEAVASRAISAGVTDYLQKSSNTDHYELLANRVRNAVEQHRATTTANRAKRRLHELAESTTDVLWMVSTDWEEVLFVNSAYEDIWGQPIDLVRERPRAFLEAVHPEDRGRVEQAMERVENGEYVDLELRVDNEGDQSVVWAQAFPVTNDDGSVTRIVGFGRDITERKQRERRFEAIFNNSYTFTGLLAPDGTLLEANERALAFGGLDCDDVVGDPVWDAYWFQTSDAARESVRQGVEQARSGEFYRDEIHIQGDDQRAVIDFSVRPITDDQGRVTELVPEGREIPKHKVREQKLERIQDFFTEAEQLGNLGAWEYDASGDVVWTDGTRRIHEVESSFEPTLEDGIEFFHPDDRATIRQAVERALEDGMPYDLTVRLITQKGNERWVRTRGKPVDNIENHPTIRGYIQDITEQKEREQELQEAKSQLEAAVNAGTIRTWEWHIQEDKLIVDAEFAKTFDVDPDRAAKGISLDHFIASIHEDDRDRVTDGIDAAMEDCGEYEAEYRVWNANDELRWVIARGEVRCDDDGTPISFPGALTDVTERKTYEQQLEEQNERLEAFASMVSHDLRNPLQVAESRLEFLADDCDSDHIDDIAWAHDRMRTLIEDLLTLAREGDSIDEPLPVALEGVVDASWRNVRTAQADLSMMDDHVIRADRDRLQQLLENLFRNAVEHGGDAVTVTIGSLDNGLYIADDGPGIAEEHLPNVFSAGYSTADDGTGFGLAIVEQIADAHGWDVSVTEAADGGARFEITGVDTVK